MNGDDNHIDFNNLEENNINPNEIIYEEEYENDDAYMMELHKKFAMMKNERKSAEKDSQILFNRLRLLKGEEEKVFK